jgi:acrylyl-CoA reductase (NADPH)
VTDSESSFRALRVQEKSRGFFQAGIERMDFKDLPADGVLIRVLWSSLNFKDSLSASGHKGVTRHYPHTPGIDAAGVVIKSDDDRCRAGDEVIVTGFDLGMNTPGGFGEYIRVPATWCIPKPPGHDLRYFMILGTAGLTAGLSVERLTSLVAADQGEILVTGATGGVGSIAVALLARLGYEVVGSTSKVDHSDFLARLGAKRVVERSFVDSLPDKPMLRSEWAGIVDTVGGKTLSGLLKCLNPGGVATACGMVAGEKLNTSIFPFILRGITLFGIDSVVIPLARKELIWSLFDSEWDLPRLESVVQEVSLDELPTAIEKIRMGKVLGRVILKHAR